MTPADHFLREVKIALLSIGVGFGTPFIAFVIGALLWKDAGAEIGMYVGFGLALAGLIAIWIRFRKKSDPLEELTRTNLQQRLQAGEILGTEKIVPLDQKDIEQIVRLKWVLTALLTPVMGGIVYLIHIAGVTLTQYAFIITPVSAVLFAFLVYKHAELLDKAIEKGEKVVVNGFVTKKYIQRSGRTRNYYVVLGTFDVYILWRYSYFSYRIGDRLEIESLKSYSNWILKSKTISTHH